MCQLTLEEKYDIIEKYAHMYMGYNSSLWKTILQFHDFEQFLYGSMYGFVKSISNESICIECMVRKNDQIILRVRNRNFEILQEVSFSCENRVNTYEKWMELVLEYAPEEIENEYLQAVSFITMNEKTIY